MRINARIAVAGERGISRFPTVPDDDCIGKDGKLDESRARQILSTEELITWAKDDDTAVMAFAIEFLRQLKNVVEWMNKQPDVDVRYGVAKTKLERRCTNKLEHGRYCHARVEIKRKADHISAKVQWSNPQGIVGEAADTIPPDFALLCVQVMMCIGDEIKKRGGIEVRIIEGENCEGYIAKARAINAENDRQLKVKALLEMRGACTRRVSEYCSPANPTCACFKEGGRCKREEEIRGR